jgi:hypothetical protein
MYIGMTQLEAEQLITQAQSAAGLENIEALVLFGGTDKFNQTLYDSYAMQ